MSMFLINDNLNPSPINNGHFLADPLPLNTSAIILPNPILPLPYSLSLLKGQNLHFLSPWFWPAPSLHSVQSGQSEDTYVVTVTS